jgi:ribosomal protein S18 acetylase RimI-like enzyme
LYADGVQAGILSLFKNNNAVFEDKNQYQIRGMAVLDKFQKKNFGRMLVEYSEEFLKSKDTQLIWFNARASAVGFYKRLGYQSIGEAFDIPDVGTHYVMWIRI